MEKIESERRKNGGAGGGGGREKDQVLTEGEEDGSIRREIDGEINKRRTRATQ